MEKKNAKLKNNFTHLISHISKLYKDTSNANNEAYLTGKKEAFEEILNWFVTSHNGELKYISATSFFNMIQEKLAKSKTALANKQAEDNEEEIKPAMNFSEIKIMDNRKRINRYAQNDSNTYLHGVANDAVVMEDGISNNSGQVINFPFSVSSLINNNPDDFSQNVRQINSDNNISNNIQLNNLNPLLQPNQNELFHQNNQINFSNPFNQNNIFPSVQNVQQSLFTTANNSLTPKKKKK